jgi:GNAT superfamily N-acetyltransferase
MTAPEVSAARPEEYAALGAIVVDAYRRVGAVFDQAYAEFVADVAGRAAAAGVVVLAARVGGELAGCATVVFGNPDFSEGEVADDIADLRMLGVTAQQQGHGCGRALVDAAISLARSRGRRQMRLHSQPMMRTAHHLYESLGFTRRPDADLKEPGGTALLAYELDLSAQPGEDETRRPSPRPDRLVDDVGTVPAQ